MDQPTFDPLQRDAIGAVLGRIPSGLYILTARSADGRETGMLASWVQQASFEPPAVTVAVNRKRYLHDWLRTAPAVVLNLIGETQKQYLSQFGRGFPEGEPAFGGISLSRSPGGLPVLADALGWLEGTAGQPIDAGDHLIYVVRITAAGRGPRADAEEPWVHLRRNGFGY
jgi:flavin reductase (DIM6/NTAB) family NADH-FMN oxidoreductase RutF